MGVDARADLRGHDLHVREPARRVPRRISATGSWLYQRFLPSSARARGDRAAPRCSPLRSSRSASPASCSRGSAPRARGFRWTRASRKRATRRRRPLAEGDVPRADASHGCGLHPADRRPAELRVGRRPAVNTARRATLAPFVFGVRRAVGRRVPRLRSRRWARCTCSFSRCISPFETVAAGPGPSVQPGYSQPARPLAARTRRHARGTASSTSAKDSRRGASSRAGRSRRHADRTPAPGGSALPNGRSSRLRGAARRGTRATARGSRREARALPRSRHRRNARRHAARITRSRRSPPSRSCPT